MIKKIMANKTLILTVLLLLIIGVYVVNYTWHYRLHKTQQDMLTKTTVTSSFLIDQQLERTYGKIKDNSLNKFDKIITKRLLNIKESQKNIKSINLYLIKQNKPIFVSNTAGKLDSLQNDKILKEYFRILKSGENEWVYYQREKKEKIIYSGLLRSLNKSEDKILFSVDYYAGNEINSIFNNVIVLSVLMFFITIIIVFVIIFIKKNRLLKAKISKLERMEGELYQASTRLSLALRAGGIGVYDYDISKDKQFWDDQMHQLYGLGEGQTPSNYEEWKKLIYPEDLPKIEESVQQALNRVQEYNTEFRIVTKSSDIKYLRALGTVQFDKNEKPIRIIGVNWDITEQKNLQKKLEREIESRKLLLENIRTQVWYLTNKYTYGAVNDAHALFLNKTKEEIAFKSMYEIFPKEFAEKCSKENEEVFNTGKVIYTENRYLDNNGENKLLSIVKSPVFNDKGELEYVVCSAEDITERKLIEEKYKAGEENFRVFFETIDDMIFIGDVSGNIIFTNSAVVNKLNYSVEELKTMHILDVHPKDKRNEAEIIFKEMLAGKRDICPLPLQRKDGNLLPVETRVWFGRWDGKNCVFGISKDLTVEQEALQKFNKLFNNNPALMALSILPERRFTEINEAFLAKTGYTRDEVIGKTSDELNLLVNNNIFLEIPEELTKTGRITNLEFSIRKKNGEILDGLFAGEIIESQGVRYFLSLMVDITSNKKLENEIKLQNSFYKVISEIAGKLIQADYNNVSSEINYSLDVLGNFNNVDRTYIFELDEEKDEINNTYEWCAEGITPEIDNLQGVPFSFIPYWKETFLRNEHIYIYSVVDLPEERQYEKDILMPQGVQSLLTVPIYYGPVIIGFLGFDSVVTKKHWNEQVIILLKIYSVILGGVLYKKKTEEILMKAKQEAEMANKSKSIFLANMSHEIRTPLNAVIGFAQLLNRDKNITDTQKEYILSIIKSGEHLLSLINDILELSKVEAGKMTLNNAKVDLQMFLDDLQITFSEKARNKHLQMLFEISDDLPKYIWVDENKLRQVFVNLISNAIKFTEEGGIAIRIKIKTVENNKYLFVEVEDSGCGIKEDEINKLFKHFVQTSSGINKGGTGLGLALSRELILLMEGEINVKSEVGKGTLFNFSVLLNDFELDNEEISVKNKILKTVLSIEENSKKYKILVVDDKEENLQVVVNLLNAVGFLTEEAKDGLIAVRKFQEWEPDLILMDLRMPILDGYEATKQIKETERGKNTPIIAITASAFEEDQSKAKSVGVEGYIRKPFREGELFEMIGHFLDINYVFEQEEKVVESVYSDNNDVNIVNDIKKLPINLINKMKDAILTADLDSFINTVEKVDVMHSKIVNYLLTLANNYDYQSISQILNSIEEVNGKK